jgi:hypothetical protein
LALRGELREKAIHYLRQAGLKASARSALQDAWLWFEQALDDWLSGSALRTARHIERAARQFVLRFCAGAWRSIAPILSNKASGRHSLSTLFSARSLPSVG